MSSFTGVSVITDGKHCTTTAIDAGTDSGYHLLVVKDYSRTVQEIPCCESIASSYFMVGGHEWYIEYYPNGEESTVADFICLNVCCADFASLEDGLKAKIEFSFVDQVEYQKPMHIGAAEPRGFGNQVDFHGCVFIERYALERSANLKDDSFTIRCDIMVCKNPSTGGTPCDIHEHLDHLLQSKVGVDVTFEVGGETFPAHRCLLAARSKVFMAQLFGPMTESTTSNIIQIEEMEAKVFAALLRFIYTDSFPVFDKDNFFTVKAIEYVMFLQDLFVAADRYDLQRLKLLCEEHLSEHIGVSSVASTLALAEKHSCRGLKEACLKFIQVQSLPCLEELMATDDWEHITMTYPSVLNELISKFASNRKDRKRKR